MADQIVPSSINPAKPTAEPANNPLSMGATDAVTMAMRAMAENIGAAAAYKRAAESGAMPGRIMGGGPASQMPSPAILPPMQPSGPMPLIGGGYTNDNMAEKYDKSAFFNGLKEGLDNYTKKKNEEAVLSASRDYETVMSAIKINQSLDPNNPEHKAMIEHNNNVINQFFADDKKVKRLQKVMGIEAQSSQDLQKAEEKKKKDPEYQAMETAKKKVEGMNVGADALGMGMQVPAPASKSLGQETLGIPSSMAPWAQGLNPAAQRFMGKQPIGPTPAQYIPSGEEMRDQWRIANKLDPDGNSRADLMKSLFQYSIQGFGDLFKGLNERDMKEAQLAFDKYKVDYEQGTAWNIALGEIGMKRLELMEKAWYDSNRLALDNKDLLIKNQNLGITLHDKQVQFAEQGVKLATDQYLAAQNAARLKKNPGKDEGNAQLVASAYQNLISYQKKLDQANKDRMEFYGKLGVTSSPSGPGTGEAIINRLESNGTEATGSSNGSGTSNSGAKPATPAAPPTNTASPDSFREKLINGILPWFGGTKREPI